MSPSDHSDVPVLLAYDGSEFARAAIEDAARQLGAGRKATVLTVWVPLDSLPFVGVRGASTDAGAVAELISETEAGARRVAEEGADLARAAGFDATAMVASGDPAWNRIVEVADELGASPIVLGSHGRSGLRYVLLGSVATAVAQHSRRSVLIVHRRG